MARVRATISTLTSHDRFTILGTPTLADGDRAHPACACPIAPHNIRAKDSERLFGSKGIAPGGVLEVRTIPLTGRGSETA